VSKVKSPQDKKAKSLTRDRRNAYGENAKSSRKNIPLSKRLSHQAARRASNQPLAKLTDVVGKDEAVAAEIEAKSRGTLKRLQGFRKSADAPLKSVLHRKKTGFWPSM
jgi:hypothetical protein